MLSRDKSQSNPNSYSKLKSIDTEHYNTKFDYVLAAIAKSMESTTMKHSHPQLNTIPFAPSSPLPLLITGT